MAGAVDNAIDKPFGRHWCLLALWCAEGSAAAAALWTLSHGHHPGDMIRVLAYLLLCAAALLTPGHVLRAGLRGAAPRRRRSALQLFLALSAAGVAASLSTGHGWAAIVCILLLGDALWALELDLRAGPA